MSKKLIKYAFIDRDGTLIHEPTPEETKPGDIPYQIDSLEKLKILAGVIEGLQKLLSAGYKLVMVTNQDGLGTDIFPLKNFYTVQNKLLEILEENKIKFQEVLICPHFADDDCECRKPKTGLFRNFLMNNVNINWPESLIIGDNKADKELAKNLRIKFVRKETNKTFKIAL